MMTFKVNGSTVGKVTDVHWIYRYICFQSLLFGVVYS